MNKKKKTRFLMKSDLRVEESVSSIPCDLFLVIGANGTSMDQLSCPIMNHVPGQPTPPNVQRTPLRNTALKKGLIKVNQWLIVPLRRVSP